MLFFINSVLPVHAGAFKVFPLKLNLDQKKKTILFKITNTGEKAVTVQLESALWLQDDQGDDQYKPTRDIVYFPKIVKVAVGEERIVRIGYRGKPASKTEKSYRLFAQELPERSELNGALSFALRFSVPIFVLAKNSNPIPNLTKTVMKNGKVYVHMENKGTKHMVVSSIAVKGMSSGDKELFSETGNGWYVLPQSSKPFPVTLPEEPCGRAESLKFDVEAANKVFKQSQKVNHSECVMVESLENKTPNLSQ